RRPILLLGLGTSVLVLVLVAAVIALALRMSRTVSGPIVRLAEAAETGLRAETADLYPRAPREVRKLVDRFNTFIDRIDQQQASLQRSVQEKTVLIRELHHRVKNNLQVIASLLNLQSADVADPRDSRLFDRSRDRVLSMALVHEQLYQTEDLSVIPFDLYLQDLVGHIRGSIRREDITLEVSGEPVLLNIDRAIPCGMIVNELVNNAYEHAFNANRSGTIRVSMTTDQNVHVLEVADSGSGISDNPRQSLGMTLVRMLVEQIGGTFDIVDGRGTTFRVEFPH
ncbi:MAG: sensor histidine kinase, partial [Spirochaetaceae bacterium]